MRLSDTAQQVDAERVLAGALGTIIEQASEPGALTARVGADATGRDRGARAVRALVELSDADIGVTDFTLGQPSLDEVFLALTGRKAAEAAASQEERA